MDSELEQINPQPNDSKWQIKRREIINSNEWSRFIHDEGETDTGRQYDYYFIDKPVSVAVIALTEDQQLIMVKQYRYVVNQETIEVPGGGPKEGVDPKTLAAEELEEETGYQAKTIFEISQFAVNSGNANEIAHVFLATGCKKISEQKLDKTEEGLEVILHPVEDVYQMVQDGKITGGFTLSALLLAWPHIL